MERFALDEKLAGEIRAGVFGEGFIKLVQSVRRNGSVFRIALRPVEIGGHRRLQAEMNDAGRVEVRNLDEAGAREGLEEIIAQKGARDLHLIAATGDLHLRVTRKGRVHVSRSAALNRAVPPPAHDKIKRVALSEFESGAMLKALGIADGEGRVRASMRGKYDQVNEFLKVVGETVGPAAADSEGALTIVDCGCGKAYLTIALWHYLTHAKGYANVRVIGVDRRQDVIESARRAAASLDLAGKVDFIEADLREFDPAVCGCDKVDMVVSLHACDTATDEALARGVEWRAQWILSAPYCQHELQKTLSDAGPLAGLLRHSILRERYCDLLTDTFRASILRILGYRAQVLEFVSPEATGRNLMIKAVWGVKCGQGQCVSEYLDLRDFCGTKPFLETRLQARLDRYLVRYG